MRRATAPFVLTLILSCLLFVGGVVPTHAQERPDRRITQTNIPPEQLVSFQPDTPFNQFLELINPVFQRVAGKTVVDPQNRTSPIGVSISGMHYLDALERVLEANGLTYEETQTAYLVREPEQGPQAAQAAPEGEEGEVLATLGTREIRINAILFNMNLTKVRDLGLRWSELFPSFQQGGRGGQEGGGQGGGGAGGGQGGQGQGGGAFLIETGNLFESVDNILQAPEQAAPDVPAGSGDQDVHPILYPPGRPAGTGPRGPRWCRRTW